MSVPENSRTKSKLEACVKAHDLCCYTLQITSNEKVFTPQFQRWMHITNRFGDNTLTVDTELQQSEMTITYKK